MVDTAKINNTMGKMGHYLSTHERICVSVSGGSDSDILIHIIAKYFREHLHKVHFVFCDTGLEYKATHNHIKFLEEKYDIKINKVKGDPIPYVVRKYGVPFVSKQVSEYIERLQKHDFEWEDKPLDELMNKYNNVKVGLRWWTNDWGEKSRFNINYNRGLKEFLINNPPTFKISSICCTKSKKNPLINFQKSINADLAITGERKSEGGARAGKTSCFGHYHGIDRYMPIFFWDDETKQWYKEHEGIVNSDCYEVWGMTRTGCVGCPFAKANKEELEILKKYEPNKYKACMNIFGKSYDFTDKFKNSRR